MAGDEYRTLEEQGEKTIQAKEWCEGHDELEVGSVRIEFSIIVVFARCTVIVLVFARCTVIVLAARLGATTSSTRAYSMSSVPIPSSVEATTPVAPSSPSVMTNIFVNIKPVEQCIELVLCNNVKYEKKENNQKGVLTIASSNRCSRRHSRRDQSIEPRDRYVGFSRN